MRCCINSRNAFLTVWKTGNLKFGDNSIASSEKPLGSHAISFMLEVSGEELKRYWIPMPTILGITLILCPYPRELWHYIHEYIRSMGFVIVVYSFIFPFTFFAFVFKAH